MSVWRWHQPFMQLHPAHGLDGLQPLQPGDVELLPLEPTVPSEIVAQVHGQALVFYPRAAAHEVLLRVPLLGLEVALRGDGEPLVTVAQADGHLWLFKCQEGLEAAYKLLEGMGASGAVRKDVVLSHEPTPLATGAKASIDVASLSFHGSTQLGVVKTFHEDSTILHEVGILSQAQESLHVVRMRGLWSDSRPGFGLLLEYCPGGDAETAALQQPFGEGPALDIISEVLQGLAHVHGLGIIHRDIKAGNILFREGGQAVISDFGLACYVSDQQSLRRRCGTPGYVAPEIIEGKGACTQSDVFSTGCTLYFLLSGKVAFSRPLDNTAAILAHTLKEHLSFSDPHFGIVSQKCRRFLKKLTKKAAVSRPSAGQALALHYTLWSSEDASAKSCLFPPSAPRRLSPVESLPSVDELPLQPRGVSSTLARADFDPDEPAIMPRGLTVHARPQMLRLPEVARSQTSEV